MGWRRRERLWRTQDERISGFGAQIAPGKWLLTNMISTRQQSTLSESYIQELAVQGPVTLFGLGEVGMATGTTWPSSRLGPVAAL